jgi:hypothetical protein
MTYVFNEVFSSIREVFTSMVVMQVDRKTYDRTEREIEGFLFQKINNVVLECVFNSIYDSMHVHYFGSQGR